MSDCTKISEEKYGSKESIIAYLYELVTEFFLTAISDSYSFYIGFPMQIVIIKITHVAL